MSESNQTEYDFVHKALKVSGLDISRQTEHLLRQGPYSRPLEAETAAEKVFVFSLLIDDIRSALYKNLCSRKGTAGKLTDRTPLENDWVEGIDYQRNPGEAAADMLPKLSERTKQEIARLQNIQQISYGLEALIREVRQGGLGERQSRQAAVVSQQTTKTINQVRKLETTSWQQVQGDFAQCTRAYRTMEQKYGDELGGENLALLTDAIKLCDLMSQHAQAELTARRISFSQAKGSGPGSR